MWIPSARSLLSAVASSNLTVSAYADQRLGTLKGEDEAATSKRVRLKIGRPGRRQHDIFMIIVIVINYYDYFS